MKFTPDADEVAAVGVGHPPVLAPLQKPLAELRQPNIYLYLCKESLVWGLGPVPLNSGRNSVQNICVFTSTAPVWWPYTRVEHDYFVPDPTNIKMCPSSAREAATWGCHTKCRRPTLWGGPAASGTVSQSGSMCLTSPSTPCLYLKVHQKYAKKYT